MARWPLPPDLHSRVVGGPVCPHAEHSIGSRDNRVPRYDDSHACVRCVAGLTEGRLSLDVHKIEKTHRRRFLEFWSYVEIRSPDECWLWHGPMHTKSNSSYFPIPRFLNHGVNTAPSSSNLVHLGGYWPPTDQAHLRQQQLL